MKWKTWQVVVGIITSVVVLAALGMLLLSAFGVQLWTVNQDYNPEEAATAPKTEELAMNFENKTAYTADHDKAVATAKDVVATIHDQELTNGMLRILYRMSVAEYINANADYLTYMDLDLSKPLGEQPCVEDGTISWEQFFIDAAIDSWINYQSVYLMAMEDGFKPSVDLEKNLQDLAASVEEMAKAEGLANADALIADRFGDGCTLADYEAYFRMYYVSAEYIDINPTTKQLEEYYEKNKDMFDSYGIAKDSGPMVNVRHILVCPQGGEQNAETGEVVFTQEQWEACQAKAESLFVKWKEGEATEETFAALANEQSEDGGSNTNGGLYTGITKETPFVEPFLNWCMDEKRKEGDTGIVRTDYGYHIMYFAHTEPQWEYYAKTYFLAEYTSEKIKAAKEQWPAQISQSAVVLAELKFA